MIQSEPGPNYVTETEVSITVWEAPDGEKYAYPLTRSFGGIKNPFPAMPDLGEPRWKHLGTLPQGLTLANVKAVGSLYRCTLGGFSVLTCHTVVAKY